MKIAYIKNEQGLHNIRSAEVSYTPMEGDIIVEVEKEEDIPQCYFMVSYAEMRAKEYPPMADYLDAVVKGDTAAHQAYVDACMAVKNKYPKGQSFRID